MRASRLLSVLLLLQNRGRMTADELAAELEVSVRTVYRDIEALSAAGVPVYADRGRAGGYQLVGGYRTRLTGLTEEEAQSLSLAGLPVAAAELGLGTVLAAAQLKLYAALPEELRDRAGQVAERFLLDVPGWFRGVESLPHLAEIARAVWECRLFTTRYRRWDGSEVDRVLEPLGLVLKAGNWYLAARAGNGVRTYRVSRISAPELGERFERPSDFDLAAYWREWSESFERRLYPRIAVVRLSRLGRDLVPFYLGVVGARALRECRNEPDEDGWLRVELPVEPGAPALGELLRFGPELQVLEPPELRAEVAAAVAKMGASYG
ncbi:putative DNA-binding transcriptional regulator YafY [Amycolatopsis bartoniae]|uniref:Transcriptional regulator n=1 Tax=Amycolatopsis bartoniae TaxID=941986 RepID=A0A8H9J290_9PSEU|nr:YafY family protein [Amycolatopsis bartoniae]MBB2938876.1 putative DNA-binding transcriptional regulator YafY [Amycolatopsis bartoniae]TVT00677.1 YafY family transcriptional regulator [Amycolatopsis bartoniae]GHF77286.1 transcriptional regulator [Amycolatopsis bartoniae]